MATLQPPPLPSDALLTLRTLGAARLQARSPSGELTDLLGPGKPLALITYVACAPGHEVPRARLVDLLWSDLDPDAAKHALRQTLWHLRRRVADDLLAANADAVSLTRPLECDRDLLLASSQSRDEERVVALYTGDFFPEFAAPGGAEFEQWAEVERRRLRQVFSAAADSLSRRWLNESRFRDAQAMAKRLRDAHPDSEPAWRLLIEAYLSSGDTLSARFEADALEAVAEREESELEGSTRAIIRTVRSPTPHSPLTSSADARDVSAASVAGRDAALVGRESEFARILDAWEVASKQGRARRLCVLARAGLGKTRLLRDVAARIRATRARVATVRGSIAQRGLPYALASEVAATLATLPGARAISPQSASVLVGLNPTLSSHFDVTPQNIVGDEALRQRTLALRELLEAVCDEHPLALFVDDYHWSDDVSQRVLASILSDVASARLLLVIASRPDDRLTAPKAHCDDAIELPALSVESVAQLVESVATVPEERWGRELASRLHQSTGGSPLLVLETLRSLIDREILVRVDDRWECRDPAQLSALLHAGSPTHARLMDLGRSERWLLSVAAAARRPFDLDAFTRADERSAESVLHGLVELERRGLLQRTGDAWQVAHDEIADAVLGVAGDEGRRAAMIAAGRVIGAIGGDDRNARIAAALFSASDALADLAHTFRDYAARAYARGDRRSVRALARELAGTAASDQTVRMLAASAPWRWRVGIVSTPRAVAAVGAIVAMTTAGGGLLASREEVAPPDAVLGVYVPHDSGGFSIQSVELRSAGWDAREALRVSPRLSSLEVPGFELTSVGGTGSQSGKGAIVTLAVNDTGVIDLFLIEPGTPPRRLNTARGDDGSPDLSPDGRYVVFSTARWDELSHYDLALLDLSTGAVSQLTSGNETDRSAKWSPDGTRVAFTRVVWGDESSQVCVVSPGERSPTCRRFLGVNDVRGWISNEHVLVRVDSAGARSLVSHRVSNGERRPVDVGWWVEEVNVSPDGRWIYCSCRSHAGSTIEPIVLPADRPKEWRRVLVDGMNVRLGPAWIRSSRSDMPRTLAISRDWANPMVGVPHTLAVRATDSLGRPVSSAGVRWRLLSSGGSIDSVTGVFTATVARPVTVEARLSESLTDRATLSVKPRQSAIVFREPWADSALSNWYAYGWPSPHVIRTADGRPAFFNNGDGSYDSGVYSRFTVSTSRGVAVDAEASTPVTFRQWQQMRIDLLTMGDASRLSRARGQNAPPYAPADSSLCSVGWPSEGESREGRRLAVGSTAGVELAAPRQRHLDGRWMHVRLQLFPDGRCGVAIDGQPIAMISKSTNPASRVRLMLGGNSYRTQFLLGPVTVMEGVPDDIDWSRALAAATSGREATGATSNTRGPRAR